jgi:hypothetical protein
MAFPAPVEALPGRASIKPRSRSAAFHIPRSTPSEVAPQAPAIIQTLDALLGVADGRYLILVRVIYSDAMTEFIQLRIGGHSFRSRPSIKRCHR